MLAKFEELFIRQGTFPKEMSRIIHHAFDMRQAGDDQKSKPIAAEQAMEVLIFPEEFMEAMGKELFQKLESLLLSL